MIMVSEVSTLAEYLGKYEIDEMSWVSVLQSCLFEEF